MDKNKASEYERMAAEFMDLWQRQWASALTNPETIKTMLGFFRNMQSAGTATGGGYGNPFTAGMESIMPGFGEFASGQHAWAASGVVEPMLAELSNRLATCESRLAAMESESTGRSKKTGRGNGKRTAAKAGGSGAKKSRK